MGLAFGCAGAGGEASGGSACIHQVHAPPCNSAMFNAMQALMKLTSKTIILACGCSGVAGETSGGSA